MQTLPHSLETEQAVLGAFLITNETHYALDKMNIDDFYAEIHKYIIKAMKNLRIEGKPIDFLQVFNEIKKEVSIDIVYLSGLANTVAFTGNIEHYINIIKEKSIQRQIIKECQKAIEQVLTTEENPTSIKSTLAQNLDSIGLETAEESDNLKYIFSKLYDKLENYDQSRAEKYYTGIYPLDQLMGGLHEEEVTVIAARPGVGKTAFVLQIALSLAHKDIKTLIVSREMSKEQLAKRIIASQCKVDGRALRKGKLEEEDWTKVINGMGRLSNLPIHINTRVKTISEIKAKLRQTKAEVLIIDYLQLLQPSIKGANREQQVAELSREIKNISLDFKLPIILLSQLNRQADSRRPILADLRESGAIEQDSNNIVFLNLPNSSEIQKIVEDKNNIITLDLINALKNKGHKLVELSLAKQRDGALGIFYMAYVPERLTFYTITNKGD